MSFSSRSPPNGLLAASDVLKPLPNPTATPFSSLFSPMSGTPESDLVHRARLDEIAAGPRIESSVERRWTYRPLDGAAADKLAERVEVAFELVDTGNVPALREMEVTKTEVKIVKENKVDLMVPTGYVLRRRLSLFSVATVCRSRTQADPYAHTLRSFYSSHDAQFTMSMNNVLEPEDYPLELCVSFLLSLPGLSRTDADLFIV